MRVYIRIGISRGPTVRWWDDGRRDFPHDLLLYTQDIVDGGGCPHEAILAHIAHQVLQVRPLHDTHNTCPLCLLYTQIQSRPLAHHPTTTCRAWPSSTSGGRSTGISSRPTSSSTTRARSRSGTCLCICINIHTCGLPTCDASPIRYPKRQTINPSTQYQHAQYTDT